MTTPVVIVEEEQSGMPTSLTHNPAYGMTVLFAHRDISEGAKRGGVVARGSFPPFTVAAKAQYGIFPWSPGLDCLARDFHMVKRVNGKLIRGDTVKGCPDCRTAPALAPEQKPEAQDTLAQAMAKIAELEAKLKELTTPQPAKVVVNKCPSCPFEAKSAQGLKVHVALRHKKEAK